MNGAEWLENLGWKDLLSQHNICPATVCWSNIFQVPKSNPLNGVPDRQHGRRHSRGFWVELIKPMLVALGEQLENPGGCRTWGHGCVYVFVTNQGEILYVGKSKGDGKQRPPQRIVDHLMNPMKYTLPDASQAQIVYTAGLTGELCARVFQGEGLDGENARCLEVGLLRAYHGCFRSLPRGNRSCGRCKCD